MWPTDQLHILVCLPATLKRNFILFSCSLWKLGFWAASLNVPASHIPVPVVVELDPDEIPLPWNDGFYKWANSRALAFLVFTALENHTKKPKLFRWSHVVHSTYVQFSFLTVLLGGSPFLILPLLDLSVSAECLSVKVLIRMQQHWRSWRWLDKFGYWVALIRPLRLQT